MNFGLMSGMEVTLFSMSKDDRLQIVERKEKPKAKSFSYQFFDIFCVNTGCGKDKKVAKELLCSPVPYSVSRFQYLAC